MEGEIHEAGGDVLHQNSKNAANCTPEFPMFVDQHSIRFGRATCISISNSGDVKAIGQRANTHRCKIPAGNGRHPGGKRRRHSNSGS